MHILHTVESYFPSVGGMQEVVMQLSERLVSLGHTVTVATSYHPDRKSCIHNGVHIEQFRICGNTVRGIKALPSEITRYQTYISDPQFDIVTNFAAQQWATDLSLPLLRSIRAKKVFVPTGFSRLHDTAYTSYFSELPGHMQNYDVNVFLSHTYQDIQFAHAHGIQNKVVIPNGAAYDEFTKPHVNIRAKLGIPQDHFLVVHVGSHTGQKGHSEAIRMFSKAKIANSTLLIIGNSFGRGCTYTCAAKNVLKKASIPYMLEHKKLLVTSLSRTDTVAAYHEADLFLFPSNIECSPLTLFEAMASSTPFLCTDVGNAAEIIDWSGGAGILLPTTKNKNGYSHALIEASARCIESLYTDEEARLRMGKAGHDAWIQNYTWEKIASNYESLYASLL